MPPFLTDDEITVICAPLTQPAAQVRYLRHSLGLVVKQKPNGRPLVSRAHFDVVMGAKAVAANDAPAEDQPDESALVLHFNKKDTSGHGQKEKRQSPKAA